MTGPDHARAHVFVTGRVQGVGYRLTCAYEAKRRGLTGWVRNLDDGRVEALFEGPRVIVEEMTAWCKRGPTAARVVDATIEWQPALGDLDAFRMTHS